MAINTLYISHHNYDWRDNNIDWLTSQNIAKVRKSTDLIDYKTTPEDLGYDNIEIAIKEAKQVKLVDFETVTSTSIENFPAYGRVYNALHRRGNSHVILTNTNDLVVQRPDRPVLWTAGCSMTEANDVQPHESWRSILSRQLNLENINLARGGTSIWWSADQLLRSDLRNGDIVVWGLTNVSRIEFAENWQIYCCPVNHYVTLDKKLQYWNIDYFESETQTLCNFRTIQQVINFCSKLNVDLYLANMLDINWLSSLLANHKNFIDLVDCVEKNNAVFVDYAADQTHPGPQQHQIYASRLLNFIKESNYGNQTF